MLFIPLITAGLLAATSVNAAEKEVVFMHTPFMDKTAYDSGEAHMVLMNLMQNFVDGLKSSFAAFLSSDEPVVPWHPLSLPAISEFVPCVDGYSTFSSNHTYACKNADLYAFVPHSAMGSDDRVGNDIWGWTDPQSGREFGLVGEGDGTAFVEIQPDGSVDYLRTFAYSERQQQYDRSIYLIEISAHLFVVWRDIKVIENFAYIGSEAEGHGVQVFDLNKLLVPGLKDAPKIYNISTDLTALYDELPIGRSHNIVAHSSKPLIAAVGSFPRNDSCAAGLIFVDVSDPANPQGVGCASEDGYTHDAQCLTYHGPDSQYVGADVCYSYNEDSLTIYDITNTSAPVIISTTPYYGVSYSHQGWVVDENDQRYLLLDDELDEVFSRGGLYYLPLNPSHMNFNAGWASDNTTVTYIWNIESLEKPVLTGHYNSPAKAIDHNLYIVNGLAYESNYKSGLRVIDISTIAEDPTGSLFEEVAYFDTHPEDDAVGGVVEFGGVWSTYPYFSSGFLLVNDMERGLFVLKLTN
ncbi:hypothetical protein BT96DRAFT_932922 [Gymnopus androsaceus JB14]|uniref:Choice-of-anchor B domain-containing protein n=1 Tax=Gymnopus androsaceus JB14 TaxID=1447944 RepID=A0A6A4ID03_9AGAR|nr:hypothetical protein BT96DRAFT_932922 [Gymnopus androsaceus JB14]